MSEAALPRAGLTAWQRWELPAFDEAQPQQTETVALPTAAELEQIHQAAQAEGYQAGYEEGKQQAASEVQRMAAMMEMLDREMQQADQQIARDLLDLSLEIARQVLQQSLQVQPELMLGIVREAVKSLPHFNQHAYLALNPEDAGIVRKHMGEQLDHTGWKILEDIQIERGGCRVETAHSQIDASLATRWQRVVATLGKDTPWLKP